MSYRVKASECYKVPGRVHKQHREQMAGSDEESHDIYNYNENVSTSANDMALLQQPPAEVEAPPEIPEIHPEIMLPEETEVQTDERDHGEIDASQPHLPVQPDERDLSEMDTSQPLLAAYPDKTSSAATHRYPQRECRPPAWLKDHYSVV